jgi:hypothetical protein
MREAAKLAKAGAAAIHVTGAVGPRAEHGEGKRACIFKEVMGCAGTHPPWFCRAFGKLPAREREKLIVDNKLCPFCLLHDKDKPCGAKQKPASVACTVPGCKGRHAQKLHEALKDILREEGRVHVLQEDDGWEDSDGAWELEEAGGMFVGAIRQEDKCSWSDACDTWAVLDEGTEAGIHQVGASGAKADEDAEENEQTEAEGLLVEGDEREYVLELLLRKASREAHESIQPAGARPAASKSKGKRNREKRLHERTKVAEKGAAKAPWKSGEKAISGEKVRHAIGDLAHNPETRGGEAAKKEHSNNNQPTIPLPTSGRECSA